MTAPKLDDIDVRILATLQREGRITKAGLAERVHLSPTPCWARLKRLEKAGLIRGHHADIRLERLANFTVVLVEITLKQHSFQEFERFETAMQRTPEVIECLATGGGIDYLLKVVVPDIDAYQRLIDSLLVAEVGIDRYFTYVVTRSVKDGPQAPVDLVACGKKQAAQSESGATIAPFFAHPLAWSQPRRDAKRPRRKGINRCSHR